MMLNPTEFFGRAPLSDDVIIRWQEMNAYFDVLRASCDRLSIETIGSDWSGQPLLLLKIGPDAPSAQRRTVAVTAGIHAHELAGAQLMPDLLFDLLTSQDAEMLTMLDRVTLLIVPCINPGGLGMIADWRAATLGTPFSGTPPPGQTHPIGHDLNRDWIVQTQPETRAVVERLYNRWRPQVALDLHEMAPNGPRYALPPYIVPVDPNVPSHLNAESSRFGEAIAAAMHAHGQNGATTGLFFDGFSPARAYLPYHGGIRILAEAAGTRLGRPLHFSADELASAPDFDPQTASDRHRAPWSGGRWSLADVAAYHRTAIMTTLHLASKMPPSTTLLSPSASCFVIPPLAMQRDPDAAWTLLRTLRYGGIEIRRALAPFQASGAAFPAGTLIVDSTQPNWPWAKTVLEIQHYVIPEGSPMRLPYDVTAQTLSLLMGVDVISLDRGGPTVSEPFEGMPGPRRFSASKSRVAIYQSRRPDASEAGWARTMLTDAGIQTDCLDDATVRFGELSDWDAIVLPHQEPDHLLDGLNAADYSQELTGGISISGLVRLRRWVAGGGTLIAIDGACRALISGLDLPIEVVPRDYLARGSILRIVLDRAHDLTADCEPELAVMSMNSVAFNIERAGDTTISVIARHPTDDPLLSGLLVNWQGLAGRAAIVAHRIGKGRIVMFGCRPLFRGQTLAARRLVVNAIRHARKGSNP